MNGQLVSNKGKVKNVIVNGYEYKTYKENGYEIISLDNNQKVTGKHSYEIKYTYKIVGLDLLKNEDILFYELIGGLNACVSNIKFKIIMPKSFNESSLSIQVKSSDKENNLNLFYTIDGNVIVGSLNNTLNSGQSINIELFLPKGYFTAPSLMAKLLFFILKPQYYFTIFIFAISALGVIIVINERLKVAADSRSANKLGFSHLVEKYNSAEISYLYYKKADNKSGISLLMDLANKGFLKIEEEQKMVGTKSGKDYKITKLKEYNGKKKNEELFLNSLFSEKNDTVKLSDLNNIFYSKVVETNNATERKLKKYIYNSNNLLLCGGIFVFLLPFLVYMRIVFEVIEVSMFNAFFITIFLAFFLCLITIAVPMFCHFL